jgi:glutathione peroxidase
MVSVNRMNTIVIVASLGLGLVMSGVAAAAPLQDIPLKDLEGKRTTLGAQKGKVLLVVNVASKCGYTKQYKPLESVYRKYKDKGLVVIGIPSNDFGGQEPGTPEEIKEFCTTKYDVTFPLMEKVQVKSGAGQHAIYAALTGKDSPFPGEVKWNFGKFLIGADGQILARFQSGDEPDSEAVTKAIEKALAKK